MVAIVVLILVAAFSSVFTYYNYNQNQMALRSDSSSISSLSGALNQVSNSLVSVQSQQSVVLTEVTQDRNSISNLSSQAVLLSQQSNSLSQQENSLSQVVSGNQQTITVMQGTISSLELQNTGFQSTINSLQQQLSTATKEIGHTFLIWNLAVTIPPGYLYYETVPDTFDYQDSFNSTNPINVYYFSESQYAQWNSSEPVSGNYTSYLGTTSQNDTFTQAEGCGGYIALYYNPSSTENSTFTPNISVTYNPSPHPTGICA
jgi:hypothetical protein